MPTPEQGKQPEPAIELQIGGEIFRATRDNTSLFRYFGRLAIYDHIFMQTGQESESTLLGAYVFSNADRWGDMVDFMVTHGYPQHIDLRQVAECDVNAFYKANLGDLQGAESVPEEWLSD